MFNYTDEKLNGDMLQSLKALVDRAKASGADESDLVRYLFLDRISHDALKHLSLPSGPEDRIPIVRILLTRDVSTLPEIAECIKEALNSIMPEKRAYPQRVDTAVYTSNKRDFSSLASTAASFISSGVLEEDALRRTISELSIDDKLAFLTWYGLKYKSGRNLSYLCAQEEPLFKKVAYEPDNSFVYEFYKRQPVKEEADADDEKETAPTHGHSDPESATEFKSMREKMVSRTFAIDKLLEKYRHLLKEEQFDSIEDSLNALRKNIRRLKVATLHDSIEKTAFIVEQNDWFEGASLIRKIADSDDVFVKQASLISRPEDLDKVLGSLEEISGFLRQRAIIRELAARDIDIFNLGFGHMPEIGDATAKLMEAFNGAANKIEDLVGKLRAELQQQTAPKMAPATIKTIVKPQDLPLVKALEPQPELPPLDADQDSVEITEEPTIEPKPAESLPPKPVPSTSKPLL